MKLSRSFFAVFFFLLLHAPHSQAQGATIQWNNSNQIIDGFGASDAFHSTMSTTEADLFFATGPGDLGLTFLRVAVPSDGSCTSIQASCAGANLTDMQYATARGARVWAAPWSPPASMKTNGSTICNTGSGNASLSTGSYPAYAAYLTNFVKTLSSLYNIDLYALSVQNEPDFCPTTYDGAVMNAAQFNTFIGSNLGPAFAANSISTLIMMPEASNFANFSSYAGAAMNGAAAAYVGINAWHDYDATYPSVNPTPNPFSVQGQKYWETEASAGPGFGPSSCNGCWDPSMADALLWAAIIDDRLAVENANSWHYWYLRTGVNDNEGLVWTDGVTVAKRAYVMGNYSKFVRPGFYRIDATHIPQTGVTVSAYKNASTGAFAVIATNQNSSNVSQTITFNGVSPSSVTPWITSGSLNLAQQPDISVTNGSFTYSLPASSVTSFVGSTSAAPVSPPAPEPPTQLTVTVK